VYNRTDDRKNNGHKKTASSNRQTVMIASRTAGDERARFKIDNELNSDENRRRRSPFITSRSRRAEDSRTFYRLDGARWSKPTRLTVRPRTCYGKQRTVPGRMRCTGRPVRNDQTMRNGLGRANGGAVVARIRGVLTNVIPTCVFRRPGGRRESSRTFY